MISLNPTVRPGSVATITTEAITRLTHAPRPRRSESAAGSPMSIILDRLAAGSRGECPPRGRLDSPGPTQRSLSKLPTAAADAKRGPFGCWRRTLCRDRIRDWSRRGRNGRRRLFFLRLSHGADSISRRRDRRAPAVDIFPIPAGTELTIDAAAFGTDRPRRVVLITSGLHGIEGFFGSAVQLALMDDIFPAWRPPDGEAVVMLHALCPFGFDQLRRTNEDNIDLNRNFLKASDSYAGSPPGYAELDPLLNPPRAAGGMGPVHSAAVSQGACSRSAPCPANDRGRAV